MGGGAHKNPKSNMRGPKGGGNFAEGYGGSGNSRVVLTGVRVSSEPVAAHGGWASRSLGEAVGTLRAGAPGTSALPFWSLLDSAEGLGPGGDPAQGKPTAVGPQPGRAEVPGPANRGLRLAQARREGR